MDILANNVLNGAKTFDINGFYGMNDKTLDIVADLKNLEAGYIAPVLSSVFSETDGHVSGKVRIHGKTDNLSLSGEGTRFDDVMLKVAYTNVPYYANGPFTIDNGGLHLDGIAVRDRFDGTGTISGGILFDHLKNIRMDTGIRMNRMEAINMSPTSGEAIYGNVFATGNVSIKGPFNAIRLDVNARTDKNGSIHIPIDNASSDANTNLLTFKEPEKEIYIDPYDVMMNRLVSESKKENDFGIHLSIAANERTEAYVEIDRLSGNALNGRGQGNIDIIVRPAADVFTINGEYTLASGKFHFNALDITQKDFTLSQGSSIRFNGDVMDSDLDIDGVYTTKASIATLIADTASVSSRRTVNCGIGISGKLREPQLTFSIDVPDIDPTTKANVESALNTEDKVQRQFLALLICTTLLFVSNNLMVNFLLQLVRSRGGNEAGVGIAAAISAMAELPTMFLFGWMLRKLRCDSWLKISAICMTVKSVICLLATHLGVLYAVQLMQAVGYGLLYVASVHYVDAVVSRENLVRAQAMLAATLTLATLLSSFFGGLILEGFGIQAVLGGSAVCAAAAAVIFLLTLKKVDPGTTGQIAVQPELRGDSHD